MKYLTPIAAALALAACSQQADDAPAPTETADTAMTSAEPTNTSQLDAEDAVGTYDVTWADGTVTTTMINADGTYVDTMEGEETATGNWLVKEGKSCLTPEGGAEMCWTDSARADDGSWTATAEDGTTVTVRKADATVAPTS